MWNLVGTPSQNVLVQQALDRCDFPWPLLLPGLAREGKTSLRVEWADLSRYNHGAEGHEHADGAHTIVREVEGRRRVLGLFYLPPHMKVVLDNSLVNHPTLAQEVFLAEGAHAADYAWMVDHGLRRQVWNALHSDEHDIAHDVPESGDINHGHSWFDGPAGYATWVGESVMALFGMAFSDVPVTIHLTHPITEEAIRVLRDAALPPTPEPPPTPDPEPEPSAARVYRAKPHSKVVHDAHRGQEPTEWFPSLSDAEAAGLRACRVCRPRA
jgi:hypothetical protein